MPEESAPTSFASKAEMYKYLHATLKEHLIGVEENSKFTNEMKLITGLSNASSLLFYALNALADPAAPLQRLPVNWVGFYLVAHGQYLALGPFQGKVACTQIKLGVGVCGTAALFGKTQLVGNVHEFPGHIACDSESESEVVVPIRDKEGKIVGVLDIDSTRLNHFDEVDVMRLTDCCVLIATHLVFPNASEVRMHGIPSSEGPHPLGRPVVTDGGIPAVRIDVRTPGPTPSGNLPAASAAGATPAATTAPASPAAGMTQRVKHIGPWKISCTRQERILSQNEIATWETEHGLSSLPDIVFPANELKLEYTARTQAGTHRTTVLTLNALEYFKAAKEFYTTRKDNAVTTTATVAEAEKSFAALDALEPYVKIPVSEGWRNAKYDVVESSIDWAFRSNFVAASTAGDTASDTPLQPVAFTTVSPPEDPASLPPHQRVDYEMLKRQDLEILLYDSFDLFEDDLHDAGVSKVTVKFRVMPTCIFILLRHVVRVDAASAVCRDVRLFHSLPEVADQTAAALMSGGKKASSTVVAEISHKGMQFPPVPLGLAPGTPAQQTRQVETIDNSHLKQSLDELVAKMQPLGPPVTQVLQL